MRMIFFETHQIFPLQIFQNDAFLVSILFGYLYYLFDLLHYLYDVIKNISFSELLFCNYQ